MASGGGGIGGANILQRYNGAPSLLSIVASSGDGGGGIAGRQNPTKDIDAPSFCH